MLLTQFKARCARLVTALLVIGVLQATIVPLPRALAGTYTCAVGNYLVPINIPGGGNTGTAIYHPGAQVSAPGVIQNLGAPGAQYAPLATFAAISGSYVYLSVWNVSTATYYAGGWFNYQYSC